MPVSEEVKLENDLYLQKYRTLKRKLKFLIYENECFQDELRKAQRKLLKVERDKSFLLDRLLNFEHVDDSSSDSDITVTSDSDADGNHQSQAVASSSRKKKLSGSGDQTNTGTSSQQQQQQVSNIKSEQPAKRKKPSVSKKPASSKVDSSNQPLYGHMTSEEIERHLESKQPLMDLLPERAPSTVPTEMFSNDPALDRFRQLNEQNETVESSPSNVGDIDESLVIDLPE